MNNIFKVYALVNEESEIKYIGITSKELDKRLNQHVNTSLKKVSSLTKKEAWIVGQFNKNKSIGIILLEDDLTKDEAIELEISYISQYGLENLTNCTLGGEGIFGYKYSPKQIANWYNLIPVKEYDLEGNFVRDFKSITDAANYYNYCNSSVGHCVSNKNITCFNKIFVNSNLNFLKDKLKKLQTKKDYYSLYKIDGTLVEKDKSLKSLYKKYNLNQRVNEFSKRVWNGYIPDVVKTKYFITTPNTNAEIILERINIYNLYNKNGIYIKSFPNLKMISQYLKCSYVALTEHSRGRLLSVKDHIVTYKHDKFIPYINLNHKKIVVFKNGVEIKRFNTIKEASDELNVDGSCISKCCRGKRKQVSGFEFRYVNDIV